MKQAGKVRKAGAVLITAVLTAALAIQAAVTVFADGEKATFTIQASSEGNTVPGVEWSVYRVAEMTRDGEFTLTEKFAESGLDIGSLNESKQSDMQKSAKKLTIYVKNNVIEPTASKTTDASGKAKMTGLERGLYLVSQTGTPGTVLIVESTPFFVALPMMENENGKKVMKYDVTASPKMEVEVPPTTEPTTEPATEPSSEPSTEPTKEPSTDPTNDPTREPETDPTSDPTKEPTTEPGTGGTSEPSTEGTTSPAESTASPVNPTTPNSGGSSGGRDRDRGKTTVIYDNNTPLASFPQSAPEVVEIEEEPVPLGALPSLPKMGDMGTGAYAAGIIISLLTGCAAFIRRKKYTGGEE